MTEIGWQTATDRRLTAVEKQVGEMATEFGKINTKLAVDAVHRNNVETKLGSIESNLAWITRLIIGAVILALIGFVMGGGIPA